MPHTARRERKRCGSAPSGGSVEPTVRGLVPDLKPEWLESVQVDERRRQTMPPMLWLGQLKTGQFHGLLEQKRFVQCFCLVRDSLLHAPRASTKESELAS